MLDPIRALLASSCSTKGIRAAATLRIWFGTISVYSTFCESTIGKSPFDLTLSFGSIILLLLLIFKPDCAILVLSSSSADKYFILFVTILSLTVL